MSVNEFLFGIYVYTIFFWGEGIADLICVANSRELNYIVPIEANMPFSSKFIECTTAN